MGRNHAGTKAALGSTATEEHPNHVATPPPFPPYPARRTPGNAELPGLRIFAAAVGAARGVGHGVTGPPGDGLARPGCRSPYRGSCRGTPGAPKRIRSQSVADRSLIHEHDEVPMAQFQPQTPLVRPEGDRKPAMPRTVRPLPPPPARAFQVLQTHRTPTQLSLFSPPIPTRGTR